MKVYVLTRGTYSDYGITGVTLDRRIAEYYETLYPETNIEEYDSLGEEILKLRKENYLYCCILFKVAAVAIAAMECLDRDKWGFE